MKLVIIESFRTLKFGADWNIPQIFCLCILQGAQVFAKLHVDCFQNHLSMFYPKQLNSTKKDHNSLKYLFIKKFQAELTHLLTVIGSKSEQIFIDTSSSVPLFPILNLIAWIFPSNGLLVETIFLLIEGLALVIMNWGTTRRIMDTIVTAGLMMTAKNWKR